MKTIKSRARQYESSGQLLVQLLLLCVVGVVLYQSIGYITTVYIYKKDFGKCFILMRHSHLSISYIVYTYNMIPNAALYLPPTSYLLRLTWVGEHDGCDIYWSSLNEVISQYSMLLLRYLKLSSIL
jgi:hypothetical protein